MSKKFRALVGAMLSASICSSCVSSGLSEVVKWGAVGIPVTGAFVYFGGRKLGLWGANRLRRFRRAQLNYYIDGKDGDGNLLGDNNDDDDAQPSNEEKLSDEDGLSDEERVAKRAEEIKELVDENNYNTLKALYDKLRGNWGNAENFLSFDEYGAETAVPYLERMFEVIFVSGECKIFELMFENDKVGFNAGVCRCTFAIKFPEKDKVSIVVRDRNGLDLVLHVDSI